MKRTAPAVMYHRKDESIPHTGPVQHGNVQQQQPEAPDDPDNSMLRIPARIKPKGHPSEKEKRRKPLIELRDEAKKKRMMKAAEPKKKRRLLQSPR
jgi:hypothetical protein